MTLFKFVFNYCCSEWTFVGPCMRCHTMAFHEEELPTNTNRSEEASSVY